MALRINVWMRWVWLVVSLLVLSALPLAGCTGPGEPSNPPSFLLLRGDPPPAETDDSPDGGDGLPVYAVDDPGPAAKPVD